MALTLACLIISAKNDQFLTVCAASEDFPHRLLDDNRTSISNYSGCTEAVQVRCILFFIRKL